MDRLKGRFWFPLVGEKGFLKGSFGSLLRLGERDFLTLVAVQGHLSPSPLFSPFITGAWGPARVSPFLY